MDGPLSFLCDYLITWGKGVLHLRWELSQVSSQDHLGCVCCGSGGRLWLLPTYTDTQVQKEP